MTFRTTPPEAGVYTGSVHGEFLLASLIRLTEAALDFGRVSAEFGMSEH